ncbi:class IV adenylate cyclase [Methanocorpusculum vombati]|uniref:Class IV adenylate cyclase n=1 Tax=Methanocorpusculum vombati TaxID=3002864 RepID=A0ABT4IPF1_9EURY|nr:class IV adenylate cyclase [Methanocorpusculum vombati]MCZ9319030.1 class IV adenylate cyclase [Methanocorpusculum sp.]MCZ0863489.1 class IV adenylate cyclase [Methanocorpusculum vombati]MDE2521304.1 class IV adenylate cyclase [Methanocorpusculum sp.]MDE2534804.1 class IV adenylate cyclase [Methanocorpusculum sp.]MDE2545335.1 class IV adenylate cyclase [Methanocorpusculum sp.]
MALEIEIKVRVPALEPIRENLKKNGAALIAEQDEHDIYYNAPHKDFAVTDEALRVRYTGNQTCGNIMPPNVTYKGPKVGREGFKAREEVIVDISSGEQFAVILERLNFRKTAEVVKHREIYQCEKAIVTLDNVAEVGTFSEIEADFSLTEEEAVAAIENVAKMAGITGERLTKSYLEILLDARAQKAEE